MRVPPLTHSNTVFKNRQNENTKVSIYIKDCQIAKLKIANNYFSTKIITTAMISKEHIDKVFTIAKYKVEFSISF